MGYKSRGNFAPCQSLSQEEFDRIFEKTGDKVENIVESDGEISWSPEDKYSMKIRG
jgi:hypothetical protein